jgi:DivIVA domain-containing protein
MALTPEDVVNKRFNPTKFREGYDQDEVDDFLDEVVVELRRLNQENEELRQRLVAGDARINELQRSAAAASAAAAAAPSVVPTVVAAPEPVAVAVQEPAASVAESMDPGNTNNLLQLARRLHEEHVREGMEKRDALIAEGHATAARVVSEAQTTQQAQLAATQAAAEAQLAEAKATTEAQLAEAKATAESQLAEAQSAADAKLAETQQTTQAQLAEAQQTQAAQLAAFEAEKSALEQATSALSHDKSSLETKIDELRSFEREYREKLRSYIEGQLHELENSSSLSSVAPAPFSPAGDGETSADVPAPQYEATPAGASAGYNGPQSPDYGAYPQPTDYPGFAAGN